MTTNGSRILRASLPSQIAELEHFVMEIDRSQAARPIPSHFIDQLTRDGSSYVFQLRLLPTVPCSAVTMKSGKLSQKSYKIVASPLIYACFFSKFWHVQRPLDSKYNQYYVSLTSSIAQVGAWSWQYRSSGRNKLVNPWLSSRMQENCHCKYLFLDPPPTPSFFHVRMM